MSTITFFLEFWWKSEIKNDIFFSLFSCDMFSFKPQISFFKHKS